MHEHAVTDALTVSFQRYPYPPSGWVETLPRSRGALPLALAAPGHLLLACPAGEAFWIGLVATGGRERSSRVGVVARLGSGERVDLATGAAPDRVPTGAAPPTGTAQPPPSGPASAPAEVAAPAPTGDAASPPASGATPVSGLPRPGFEVPPRFAVEGIARQGGGWWALALAAPGRAAPACVGLELAVWTGPAAAPARRGRPSPLHDPAHLSDPTKPGNATHPTPPTEPAKPADPINPTGPADRTGPTDPTGRPSPPPGGVPPAGPAGGPAPPPAQVPAGPAVLVRVELVDVAGFEAATGRRVPGPVGDDAGYGGWRLP
jgi:hypothetical protein